MDKTKFDSGNKEEKLYISTFMKTYEMKSEIHLNYTTGKRGKYYKLNKTEEKTKTTTNKNEQIQKENEGKKKRS